MMQATYDSQGKIVIEDDNKDLVNMNGEVLTDVTYTHGNAPAPDPLGSWNVIIAQRVDLALLEQVSNHEFIIISLMFSSVTSVNNLCL